MKIWDSNLATFTEECMPGGMLMVPYFHDFATDSYKIRHGKLTYGGGLFCLNEISKKRLLNLREVGEKLHCVSCILGR